MGFKTIDELKYRIAEESISYDFLQDRINEMLKSLDNTGFAARDHSCDAINRDRLKHLQEEKKDLGLIIVELTDQYKKTLKFFKVLDKDPDSKPDFSGIDAEIERLR